MGVVVGDYPLLLFAGCSGGAGVCPQGSSACPLPISELACVPLPGAHCQNSSQGLCTSARHTMRRGFRLYGLGRVFPAVFGVAIRSRVGWCWLLAPPLANPPNFNSCKINFTSFVKLAILGSMVKQRDIIKTIKKHAKENGLELTISEGGNHTKIKLGDKMAPIPRHREIGKTITKEIYKQLGIE